MEKKMAMLSNILAWEITGTEKPGRQQSRVLYNLATKQQRLHFAFPAWEQ